MFWFDTTIMSRWISFHTHIHIGDYISYIFSWYKYYILIRIIPCGYILRKQRHIWKKQILGVSSSIAASLILVNILKIYIQQIRPYKELWYATGTCPNDYSFPSAHSALARSVAITMGYFDPKRKRLYYTLAILVCVSRMYLVCHYPSDVLVGSAIGVLMGYISIHVYKKHNTSI